MNFHMTYVFHLLQISQVHQTEVSKVAMVVGKTTGEVEVLVVALTGIEVITDLVVAAVVVLALRSMGALQTQIDQYTMEVGGVFVLYVYVYKNCIFTFCDIQARFNTSCWCILNDFYMYSYIGSAPTAIHSSFTVKTP